MSSILLCNLHNKICSNQINLKSWTINIIHNLTKLAVSIIIIDACISDLNIPIRIDLGYIANLYWPQKVEVYYYYIHNMTILAMYLDYRYQCFNQSSRTYHRSMQWPHTRSGRWALVRSWRNTNPWSAGRIFHPTQ